jgi:alpha-D-ribose 1-methylphosphonate 5-triphosphate diphosphatase
MDGFGRSPERGRRLYEMVVRYRSEGTVRHELHLRCELPDERSVDAVEALLSERKARIISVMDHTPGQGQFRDLEWYQRYRAQHVGADEREIARAVARVTHAHDGTPSERIDRIARAAGGAVFASHDDDTAERVELLAGKGVRISEFPVSEAAARRARELGTLVCVGAPNVVRGRSLSGNLSATEAVRLGLADALCSDYHPPSMLLAAFKLAGDGVLPLHQAVGLVSSGPARAAGLSDRGEVREGALADLLVVGERLGLPAVARTVVAGDVVLATGPGAPRYGSGRALVADAP